MVFPYDSMGFDRENTPDSSIFPSESSGCSICEFRIARWIFVNSPGGTRDLAIFINKYIYINIYIYSKSQRCRSGLITWRIETWLNSGWIWKKYGSKIWHQLTDSCLNPSHHPDVAFFSQGCSRVSVRHVGLLLSRFYGCLW
jgi:hypothetical protein